MDQKAAKYLTRNGAIWVAISKYIQDNIKIAYGVDSQIIYPPVETEQFTKLTRKADQIEDFYIYFGRIADEILRYNRIKSFIFKPTAFLSFNDVNYDMTDDELIINAALLTQDYFANLVPMHKNSYTFNIARDMALPNITLPYINEVQME